MEHWCTTEQCHESWVFKGIPPLSWCEWEWASPKHEFPNKVHITPKTRTSQGMWKAWISKGVVGLAFGRQDRDMLPRRSFACVYNHRAYVSKGSTNLHPICVKFGTWECWCFLEIVERNRGMQRHETTLCKKALEVETQYLKLSCYTKPWSMHSIECSNGIPLPRLAWSTITNFDLFFTSAMSKVVASSFWGPKRNTSNSKRTNLSYNSSLYLFIIPDQLCISYKLMKSLVHLEAKVFI